jgi:hypothetical protein
MALVVLPAPIGSPLGEAALADPHLAAIEAHPLAGRFGRAYYPLAVDDPGRDASLAVLDGGTVLGWMAGFAAGGRLGWFHAPAQPFFRADLDAPARAHAGQALVAGMEAMRRDGALAGWSLSDPDSAATLSALGEAALAHGAAPRLALVGVHDLVLPEERMRQALRRRYRPMVNWGRDNLALAVIDAAHPDAPAFDEYRGFHARIAGRVTRADASWQAMYDAIVGGDGELLLGRLVDGTLVAGLMAIDGTETTIYASGVFDRTRFDLPLAHYPMWRAMLGARGRGRRRFELGDVAPPEEADAKAGSIAHFKRGFAGAIEARLWWQAGR